VYKCSALHQQDQNLVVKVSNDEGDGTKFESVRTEHDILTKLASGSSNANIVQFVDYYEDKFDKHLNYLVLRNAGDMSLQDLVEDSSENEE
jgi:pantothenate kinase-related protein Tda10